MGLNALTKSSRLPWLLGLLLLLAVLLPVFLVIYQIRSAAGNSVTRTPGVRDEAVPATSGDMEVTKDQHDSMMQAIDADNDGWSNYDDNCPGVANPSQVDANANGTGDACEDDSDGDGFPNRLDNCPAIANRDQGDRDFDGKGDACDSR